ncbi:MAG: purine-binding chemotaxis protein CheW [Frankiaceae bacterium]|nr:purine-binding chemotaxis protein CheW [Frankiaceae bacterium]MDX6274194.1 purine-binding chemotaxis protein CheW [Frankiales bacterium]
MTPGYVTFRLGEREFATPLAEVREVVRLTGLQVLPGMEPPLVGVIQLRGNPLPVLDVRSLDRRGSDQTPGDVLVVVRNGEPCGIAVDTVTAVRGAGELHSTNEGSVGALPGYVVEVLRDATGPVMLVDLERLVASLELARA